MDNKILDLEEYKRLLELQRQYEEGLITEKDMNLEDMEAINKIYARQIKELRETLSKKIVQTSREWYK